MILEKQCEQLQHWFDTTYMGGKLKIRQGVNTKDRYEEYNIDVVYAGKQFGSELRVPPGGEDQEREFIDMFRQKFVEQQKKKIADKIRALTQ